jgi:Family of unknown function (DUF6220)
MAVADTAAATGSRWVRRAVVVVAWVFVVSLVVQFLLVGSVLFEVPGVPADLHRDFAYTYGWLAPIIVLLTMWAPVPRRARMLAVLLLVLYAIETYLPTIADVAPVVAAVHAVNALAVFWVALELARTVSRNPTPAGTPDR